MTRRLLRTLLATVAVLLLGQAAVGAHYLPYAGYGEPSAPTVYVPTLLTLDEARARLDYKVPEPAWLPSGLTLVGAYFPRPPLTQLYQAPNPDSPLSVAARERLQPVALVYRGPQGLAVLTRAMLSVGLPDLAVRPYGLEAVPGDLESTDGFEYKIRRNITGSVFDQADVSLTVVTWEYKTSLNSDLELYGMTWTLAGTLSDDVLIQVARSVR
jgi:hypothetical protein